MGVFGIIGTVIGALLALILLVLLIPVGLSVKYAEDKGITVRVKILFLSFALYPAKKKKKKKKKSKAEKEKESAEKPKKSGNIIDRIDDTVETVKEFSFLIRVAVTELKKLLKKLVISRFRIKVTVGDGDDSASAALTYGAVCAVAYPLIEWLHEELKFRKNAERIHIGCDFEREKTQIELDFKVSLRVCYALFSALRLLKAYINKNIDEE